MPEAIHRSQVVDVNRMSVHEFRAFGYLQEVNRKFLHPLGLALEVGEATEPTRVLMLTEPAVEALRLLIDRVRSGDPAQVAAMDALEQLVNQGQQLSAGDEILGGIWDCRDDHEGIMFGDDLLDPHKAVRVTDEWNLRGPAREASLGFVVQPIDPRNPPKPDDPPANPSNRG